jgi:hypothetical protein
MAYFLVFRDARPADRAKKGIVDFDFAEAVRTNEIFRRTDGFPAGDAERRKQRVENKILDFV